ncbi:glutamate receptor ionotropic, kainate 2 [Cimex lectularius]|uniref:Ionotropic glutamate receptor C-terminal domain-containing protein n=1 Tax=Cimex lectularius TaxID=79782 RepID=A0A8I6TJ09_CIMLE|nr:glutamate receptor ionotropic, kainate 2 [Cimex lectularius]
MAALSFSAFISMLLVKLCANYYPNATLDGSFDCDLKNFSKNNDLILKGRTLKILTFDDMPLSGVKKGTGKRRLDGIGIAFELVKTLQQKYGFEYEVTNVLPVVGDKDTGALSKLVNMEADMVAAFLPVLPQSHQYITWGVELYQASYYVLMKRPADSNTGSGLLAPFDSAVWVLILISLLAVGPIMYLVMWLRMKLCRDEYAQVFPLPSCVWFVYGALMKQGSTLNPRTDSARMLFATWWIFILILTAFYTANLTAFLTLSLSTLPIKEVKDVAKDNNKWFATQGGAIADAVKGIDVELNALKKTLGTSRSQFIETKSEATISQKIMTGWLYLDDWYTVTRLMYNDYKKKSTRVKDERKRCSYVITDKSFLIRSLAFAYQNNSVLPNLFNPILQRFVESGILKHSLGLELPDAVVCPLNLGNKERRLRNSDLYTTYVVVLSGFTCALAVFGGEIIWRWYVGDKRNYPWNKKDLAPKRALKIYPTFQQTKLANYQTAMKINGRDYFMINSKDGHKRFIPLRTPSALLFH